MNRNIRKGLLGKNHNNFYELLDIIKDSATAKFNESIDLAIELNIDPTKSNENVRALIELPFGVPKSKKLLVITEKPEVLKNISDVIVGGEELIEKITNGSMINNIDMVLTTPQMFPKILKIAKILGKAGLMPNLKDGTVSDNLPLALDNILSGKNLTVRNDKSAYIQCNVGKKSFDNSMLADNIKTVVDSLLKFKPAKTKIFIKKIHISSTMGIGRNLPLKYVS